jgi:hypothetical protein
MPRITLPYDSKEIETTDTYAPMFPGAPGSKKFATPISPKENYTLVYSRKLPHWIPQFTDTLMLGPRIDPDNIARAIVMEADPLSEAEMIGGKDRHGIEWLYVPSAQGSMVKPGNPTLSNANDWEKVVSIPDVDSWDWEASAVSNKPYIDPNRFLSVTILSGFFERLISLMDFGEAAVALIDEDQQDSVIALFSTLADVYCKMLDHFKASYNADMVWFHDDWGSQRNPFFSLSTVEEMIVPYLGRVVDHAHSIGMFFDMHSCGKNEKLVPAYVAAGCDSWSGQEMNDMNMIFDKYGDKLILGLQPDILINPLTPEADVIASAKRFVAKYGPEYDKKPVLAFAMSDLFGEVIYEESRKFFQ